MSMKKIIKNSLVIFLCSFFTFSAGGVEKNKSHAKSKSKSKTSTQMIAKEDVKAQAPLDQIDENKNAKPCKSADVLKKEEFKIKEESKESSVPSLFPKADTGCKIR